jgi:hypothetical protein
MTAYKTEEETEDKERILQALDALQKLQQEYADVIAIPEIVTLHDITDYRLDHYRGVRQFKEMFDRAAALAVLRYFAGQDFISPEHFEHTIVCALEEHKQQSKGR